MWSGHWPTHVQHGGDYARLHDHNEGIPMKPLATKGQYTQVAPHEYAQQFQQPQYIAPPPEILPPRPARRNRLNGWRAGALSAAGLGFVSLLVNIIAAAWLNSHAIFEHGLAELYQDDCAKIRRTNTFIHLTINILSTLLLGGSNYCMQCLVAPDRQMVDKAHRKGKWLDIGIPSIRNLGSVPWLFKTLWIVLVLSSLPLHLMYNSSIYASLATRDYDIYVMSSNYIDTLNVNNLTQDQEFLADIAQWKTLDNAECIREYARDINSGSNAVIIVTTNETKTQFHTERYKFSDQVNLATQFYGPYPWICSDPNADSKYDIPAGALDSYYSTDTTCYEWVSLVEAAPDKWAPFGYPASHCLSHAVQETCGLNANMPILITVIVCNAIKCLIMLYVALFFRHKPLIVVGDAIESFLNERDNSTYGAGLLSRRDVVKTTIKRLHSVSKTQPCVYPNLGQSLKIQRPRRFAAASGTRWVVTVILFCVAIAATLTLLIYGIKIQFGSDQSIQLLWRLGFGAVNGLTLIAGRAWIATGVENYSRQVMASILIANIPQLVLSILYFNLNGLLTSICLAVEWAKFSTRRDMLRVSTPKGPQKSTFFLTIPYRYAIPLLIASAVIHWLISQSIFLAVVNEVAADGLSSQIVVATCGYSPMAIIFCAIVAALVLFIVVGMGFVRITTDIPLAGSCSVAISAACHPPPAESQPSLKPVQWGLIPGSMDAYHREHCAFSSGEVGKVVEGRQYW